MAIINYKKLNGKTAALAIVLAALFMLFACSAGDYNDSNELTLSFNTGNSYAAYNDNDFVPAGEPSYFAVYSNTASYANFRRHVNFGHKISPDSVRTDEFINYFSYSYPQPGLGQDAALSSAVYSCLWQPNDYILRLGITTRDMEISDISANLVFLIDVSGSMMQPDRLELAKTALTTLVRALADEQDAGILTGGSHVSIVAYAGEASTVLDGQTEVKAITDAIDNLSASGGTYGEQGIVSAFSLAEKNYISGGNNRIILVTDGDFNLGMSGSSQLRSFISDKREDLTDSGKDISLHCVGFGYGNLRDDNLHALANAGGGGYSYVDSYAEAHRIFAESFKQELLVFATGAKAMVEFNPEFVDSYRQIGYEFYQLDFAQWQDDGSIVGKLGYGHTVTALYQFKLKPDTDIESLDCIADFSLKYYPITEADNTDGTDFAGTANTAGTAGTDSVNNADKTNISGGYDKAPLQIDLRITGADYTDQPQSQDTFISCTALTALALRDTGNTAQKLNLVFDTLNGIKTIEPDFFNDIYKSEFLELVSILISRL